VVQRYRLKEPIPPDVVHTKSPSFLKVNPNGHIPTIDDDGLVLHESLAINLYLAKKHGGPLAPATVVEDGQMTMWALWAATEMEPHSLSIAQQGPTEPAIAALRAPFAVLDQAVGGGLLVGGASPWQTSTSPRSSLCSKRSGAIPGSAEGEEMVSRVPVAARFQEDVGGA
jgi:glutathione S-transferase